MRYSVRVLRNAQLDIAGIEAYLDENAPHETERCLDAVEHALDWLSEHAHQPPETRWELRRVSTDPFRYTIWYRLFELEKYVQVVAVLHHRRGDHALVERLP